MGLACSKHCRLQQPRVCVKLDFRYETLKKEIKLNSFSISWRLVALRRIQKFFFRENPFEQHEDKPGFKQPLNQRDGKIKNNKFYRRVPKFLFHYFLPPERNYNIVLHKRYLELGARSLLNWTTYKPQHIRNSSQRFHLPYNLDHGGETSLDLLDSLFSHLYLWEFRYD